MQLANYELCQAVLQQGEAKQTWALGDYTILADYLHSLKKIIMYCSNTDIQILHPSPSVHFLLVDGQMWRHGSFKPGIFVPKAFLATHQRRSGNWSAEKKREEKSQEKKTRDSSQKSTNLRSVKTCTISQIEITFALTDMMVVSILQLTLKKSQLSSCVFKRTFSEICSK